METNSNRPVCREAVALNRAWRPLVSGARKVRVDCLGTEPSGQPALSRHGIRDPDALQYPRLARERTLINFPGVMAHAVASNPCPYHSDASSNALPRRIGVGGRSAGDAKTTAAGSGPYPTRVRQGLARGVRFRQTKAGCAPVPRKGRGWNLWNRQDRRPSRREAPRSAKSGVKSPRHHSMRAEAAGSGFQSYGSWVQMQERAACNRSVPIPGPACDDGTLRSQDRPGRMARDGD